MMVFHFECIVSFVDYRRRIELIQDFEFNQSCQKIKVSQDGNYIMTSGMFFPCVMFIN